MFHVLLYLVTGFLAGVALMHWWDARAESQRVAQSATHGDPARTLADAVLTVALLTLRKEDVVQEGETAGNDGLRLPPPTDIVGFMSQGGAHTVAVRRYLEHQFPSIQDVGAFVMEVEAILSAFTESRAKSDTAAADTDDAAESVSNDVRADASVVETPAEDDPSESAVEPSQ